jgi:3alpha(or 20beta)-hydroxysteroid dehydrogenase
MSRLNGKVAIVTGGSHGQGAAEAELFVAEGARVVIADISDADGEALAARLGASAVYRHLDVTDESAWEAVAGETVSRWDTIDVLVNNAGLYRSRSLEKETAENYMRSIRLNQIGPFLGGQCGQHPAQAVGKGVRGRSHGAVPGQRRELVLHGR